MVTRPKGLEHEKDCAGKGQKHIQKTYPSFRQSQCDFDFDREAGLNTSTMSLRVVRDDKKRSLNSETVNYGRESQGTQTRERLRWQGPAAYVKHRPVLSSERAPYKINTITVKR
jgi:hypothetical protein